MIELDDTIATHRRRLAQVYRYGRVLRHISEGGHVSIKAEVPRRIATRWSSLASDNRDDELRIGPSGFGGT